MNRLFEVRYYLLLAALLGVSANVLGGVNFFDGAVAGFLAALVPIWLINLHLPLFLADDHRHDLQFTTLILVLAFAVSVPFSLFDIQWFYSTDVKWWRSFPVLMGIGIALMYGLLCGIFLWMTSVGQFFDEAVGSFRELFERTYTEAFREYGPEEAVCRIIQEWYRLLWLRVVQKQWLPLALMNRTLPILVHRAIIPILVSNDEVCERLDFSVIVTLCKIGMTSARQDPYLPVLPQVAKG